MAFLKIQAGDGSGTVVPLDTPTLVIGRGEKAGLRLHDHGSSRQHAEIFHMGALHFVRDLGSRNGTFVNDRRIGEAVLRDGDLIQIGDTVLAFLERQDSPRTRVLRLQASGEGLDAFDVEHTLTALPPAARELHPSVKESADARRDLPAQAARILALETDPERLYGKLIAVLGKSLNAERADLLLIESASPELRFRPAAAFDRTGEGEFAVSRTILAEVVERKVPVLLRDARGDQRFANTESILSRGIRSVVCVPVVAGGSVAAVIHLSNSLRAAAFEREDLELAAQLGLQLGAVLAREREGEARAELWRGALLLVLRGLSGEAPRAAERALRVAGRSEAIARTLGLAPAEAERAWVAGLLHDVPAGGAGGAGPADGGPAARARELARGLPSLESVVEAIACQDERHDGSGAPAGKAGDEVPLLGRILAVAKEADRLQALPGRGAGEGAGAGLLARVGELLGGRFDPDVVRAFLVALRNGALSGPER